MVARDYGVELLNDEVNSVLNAGTRQIVAALRTSERIADDRQSAIETESYKVGIRHKAASLVLKALFLCISHIGHFVYILNKYPAVAHILPDILVKIGVDVSVLIAVDSRGKRTIVILIEHDGVVEEDMVVVSKCIGHSLPVVLALGGCVS